MSKISRLVELDELLKSNAITEAEFVILKDEIFNEDKHAKLIVRMLILTKKELA